MASKRCWLGVQNSLKVNKHIVAEFTNSRACVIVVDVDVGVVVVVVVVGCAVQGERHSWWPTMNTCKYVFIYTHKHQ